MNFRLLPALAAACAALVAAAGDAVPAGFYRNPVGAGDHPDPSVIRVNGEYWATATSAEWAPHFPLLRSRDLVNWDLAGYVFDVAPSWAKGSFWAPEIAEDRGTFFIYYTARRHDGRLAVAVASAKHPAGPYTDHGQLVAQEMGSIDAAPFTDAKGIRWLLWKEDGNSRRQPTLMWIQRLSEDGLKLVGQAREILRNEPGTWEGGVIEAPFVLRRGDWYYLFYSGNACCGRGCDYKLGVARAKDMLGPWEKAPSNPILAANEAWKCPGHGSIVTDASGRTWLLYHAYSTKGFVVTGRQMLLDEIVFGADGWPSINGGRGPSARAAAPVASIAQVDGRRFRDDFDGAALRPGWQWPIARRPELRVAEGALIVRVGSDVPAAALRRITTPSFVAETAVDVRGLAKGAFAGLAVLGDPANALAVVTDGRHAQVWSHRRGEREIVAEHALGFAAETVRLRAFAAGGARIGFAVQSASGRWSEFTGAAAALTAPSDRVLRTGVFVAGNPGAEGRFDYFQFTPGDEDVLRAEPAVTRPEP